MKKYNLPIVFSGKVYRHLDFLQDYSREIIKINDTGKCSDGCKIYAYDIVLETKRHNSTYIENLELKKDKILNMRRRNTKAINENNFIYDIYNNKDPEVFLVRPKKLNTFLKYYNHAYMYYKEGNYYKSLELIKYAVTLNPKDLRTKQIYEEIERILKDK